MEDTQEPRVYRVVIRLVVPPRVTAIQLPDILEFIKGRELVVLGAQMTSEGEDALSDPSILA